MIRRIDLRGGRRAGQPSDYRRVVPRAEVDVDAVLDVVRSICDDVRDRGAVAVREHTRRLDRADVADPRVPRDALRRALADLEPQLRAAFEDAANRVRAVCTAERGTDVVTAVVSGGRVTRRLLPLRRVGVYVPGGLAPLPSSVVMNVVPAQVAGVGSIAVCSPPQRDHGGLPHPTVLATCALLGIDEVYAVGGAQAVAMLAYGAGGCAPVGLVAGPGNVHVAAAKRLVRGRVGVDAEAGPTEVAVLADETADASLVAADLVSQAEHDPLAAAVLVTSSTALADAVEQELAAQVALTKHAERVIAALSARQSAIVLVDDLAQGLAVVNGYAPEHLEVHTVDPAGVAEQVTSAGAVFVGRWSPVSLGDYLAGSNHVLPTGGCAVHASGLSVTTFQRSMQVVDYTEPALRTAAPGVAALADAEDLPAHAAAVHARMAPPRS